MKRILFALLFTGIGLAASAEAAGRETPGPEKKKTKTEIPVSAQTVPATSSGQKQHFLPTRKRIDREIDKMKFVYKGEVITGLAASYGTLTSDDTDILTILDNINASGSVTTIQPYFGFFYRDNNCVGLRFSYRHLGGTLDNLDVDLGPSNDTNLDIPYLDASSNNYSFGIFHRSYAGLDTKGRFGLFAEFELSASKGSSEFAYETGGEVKRTFSDNLKLKLEFHPGVALYVFPNVCATLSFGLGGIQYTDVTQKNAAGEKIGSRKASKMRFRLNIADINIGMSIHLWDKGKK